MYGVHRLKNEDKNVEVNHCNISSKFMLEGAIKGSDTVLYFSHDYFNKTEDKNDQIVDVAKMSKVLGVKKLIVVTPLEFVNFKIGSILENPILELNQSHDKAL